MKYKDNDNDNDNDNDKDKDRPQLDKPPSHPVGNLHAVLESEPKNFCFPSPGLVNNSPSKKFSSLIKYV